MRRRRAWFIILALFIWLLGIRISSLADTSVSGTISSDTTWTLANSPYIVAGSILVNSGVTLTIEPGVIVKFDTGKSLQVNGTLIARGTSSNKITFTSNQTNPAPGDWGFIQFTDSSIDATFNVEESNLSDNPEEAIRTVLEFARRIIKT